jgi:hypothetical protein
MLFVNYQLKMIFRNFPVTLRRHCSHIPPGKNKYDEKFMVLKRIYNDPI